MEAILTAPTCRHCGHKVENDCPIGAGCPKCGKRFLPDEPSSAPGPGETDFRVLRGELDRIDSLLNAERGVTEALRGRVAELERENAQLKADSRPKGKGGARGDS